MVFSSRSLVENEISERLQLYYHSSATYTEIAQEFYARLYNIDRSILERAEECLLAKEAEWRGLAAHWKRAAEEDAIRMNDVYEAKLADAQVLQSAQRQLMEAQIELKNQEVLAVKEGVKGAVEAAEERAAAKVDKALEKVLIAEEQVSRSLSQREKIRVALIDSQRTLRETQLLQERSVQQAERSSQIAEHALHTAVALTLATEEQQREALEEAALGSLSTLVFPIHESLLLATQDDSDQVCHVFHNVAARIQYLLTSVTEGMQRTICHMSHNVRATVATIMKMSGCDCTNAPPQGAPTNFAFTIAPLSRMNYIPTKPLSQKLQNFIDNMMKPIESFLHSFSTESIAAIEAAAMEAAKAHHWERWYAETGAQFATHAAQFQSHCDRRISALADRLQFSLSKIESLQKNYNVDAEKRAKASAYAKVIEQLVSEHVIETARLKQELFEAADQLNFTQTQRALESASTSIHQLIDDGPGDEEAFESNPDATLTARKCVKKFSMAIHNELSENETTPVSPSAEDPVVNESIACHSSTVGTEEKDINSFTSGSRNVVHAQQLEAIGACFLEAHTAIGRGLIGLWKGCLAVTSRSESGGETIWGIMSDISCQIGAWRNDVSETIRQERALEREKQEMCRLQRDRNVQETLRLRRQQLALHASSRVVTSPKSKNTLKDVPSKIKPFNNIRSLTPLIDRFETPAIMCDMEQKISCREQSSDATHCSFCHEKNVLLKQKERELAFLNDKVLLRLEQKVISLTETTHSLRRQLDSALAEVSAAEERRHSTQERLLDFLNRNDSLPRLEVDLKQQSEALTLREKRLQTREDSCRAFETELKKRSIALTTERNRERMQRAIFSLK